MSLICRSITLTLAFSVLAFGCPSAPADSSDGTVRLWRSDEGGVNVAIKVPHVHKFIQAGPRRGRGHLLFPDATKTVNIEHKGEK